MGIKKTVEFKDDKDGKVLKEREVYSLQIETSSSSGEIDSEFREEKIRKVYSKENLEFVLEEIKKIIG